MSSPTEGGGGGRAKRGRRGPPYLNGSTNEANPDGGLRIRRAAEPPPTSALRAEPTSPDKPGEDTHEKRSQKGPSHPKGGRAQSVSSPTEGGGGGRAKRGRRGPPYLNGGTNEAKPERTSAPAGRHKRSNPGRGLRTRRAAEPPPTSALRAEPTSPGKLGGDTPGSLGRSPVPGSAVG